MAAFKAHATFGFWMGAMVNAAEGLERKAMGQLGRITNLADLPDEDDLKAMVKKAVALAEQGVKAMRPGRQPKPAPLMPEDFAAALKARRGASAKFDRLIPYARRDYIEWVIDAKRAETRARRIAQAVGWIAEGKARNWKYEQG
jgi:uncharacterized protein YdeI (YjbR/CyaY-like superfamily)